MHAVQRAIICSVKHFAVFLLRFLWLQFSQLITSSGAPIGENPLIYLQGDLDVSLGSRKINESVKVTCKKWTTVITGFSLHELSMCTCPCQAKKKNHAFHLCLLHAHVFSPSISLSSCPSALSHLYSHHSPPVTSHHQISCLGTVCITSSVWPWINAHSSVKILRTCHGHAVYIRGTFMLPFT